MAAIIYTFMNHNYFTAPFLILFVVGFWYTGFMSIFQGRFDRWKASKTENEDENDTPARPFPVGV